MDEFERAQRILPGGVNSPVRAFRAVGREPLFIDRGEGAYVYDISGRRYIDYVMSWGPLILGHARAEVVSAVEQAVRKGLTFGAPTVRETQLAEEIAYLRAKVAYLEKLRALRANKSRDAGKAPSSDRPQGGDTGSSICRG